MRLDRFCEVRLKEDASMRTRRARFHVWGYKPKLYTDYKGPQTPQTVAIVELEDGTVKMVKPERVRFLDGVTSF